VASIERTAYPRFKKVVSARELYEAFTPTPAEMAWAKEATRTGGNLLVLVVLLLLLDPRDTLGRTGPNGKVSTLSTLRFDQLQVALSAAGTGP
jgi:hypothetical protein